MSKANGTILYQKIIEDISHAVETGALKPGDRLPTEIELMKKYGVSRITVSKAMTDLKNRDIIVRYNHKGTFVKDPKKETSAHPLRQVVFIIPQMIDQFAISIFQGIRAALPREGYMLTIIPSGDSSGENYALKKCLDTGTDGVILFPADQEYYSDQVLAMKINKYPFVLIDRFFPGIDTNYVISDNIKSGEIAAKYLYKLGHRNIALFSNTHHATFSVGERINGYRHALEEYGVLPQEGLICTDWTAGDDLAACQKMLEGMINDNDATAIIAMQSGSALLLYHTLNTMGLKVPDDISLLSFDNPLSDIKDFQFFTHIFQNEYQMGFQAAKVLKDMLESKTAHRDKTKKIVLEPTLITSASTVAPLLI